jgi:hypothetical protein
LDDEVDALARFDAERAASSSTISTDELKQSPVEASGAPRQPPLEPGRGIGESLDQRDVLRSHLDLLVEGAFSRSRGAGIVPTGWVDALVRARCFDVRRPNGRTERRFLTCRAPPDANGEVPDDRPVPSDSVLLDPHDHVLLVLD